MFTFWIHFIYMLNTCQLQHIYITITLHLHNDYICFTCWIHVNYNIFTFQLHCIYILFTFVLHIVYMLHTSQLHNIYKQLHWHFRSPTFSGGVDNPNDPPIHPILPVPAPPPPDPSLLIGKVCAEIHAGPDAFKDAVAHWRAKYPMTTFPDPGKNLQDTSTSSMSRRSAPGIQVPVDMAGWTLEPGLRQLKCGQTDWLQRKVMKTSVLLQDWCGSVTPRLEARTCLGTGYTVSQNPPFSHQKEWVEFPKRVIACNCM